MVQCSTVEKIVTFRRPRSGLYDLIIILTTAFRLSAEHLTKITKCNHRAKKLITKSIIVPTKLI